MNSTGARILIGLLVLSVLAPTVSADGCLDGWEEAFNAGRKLEVENKYAEAIEPMERALLIARGCDYAQSQYSRALGALAGYRFRGDDPDESVEFLRSERSRIDEVRGAGEPSSARLILAVGDAYWSARRYDLAEKEYRYAIGLAWSDFEAHADVITLGLEMLSGLYQAQGRYPDAIDAYLEAKGIRCTLREICPASDQKLARLYRAAGDLAAAAEQYAGFLEASCNGSYDRETREEYAAVLTEMGDHRRAKAVRAFRLLPEPEPLGDVEPNPLYHSADKDIPTPCLLKRVSPVYPEAARVERVSGQVVLIAVLLRNGTIGTVEVIKSSKPGVGFEEAAIEAVKQWRFKPLTRGGQPLDLFHTVVVNFSVL